LAHNGVVANFKLVAVFEDKHRCRRVRSLGGRYRLPIGWVCGGISLGSILGLSLFAGIEIVVAITSIGLLVDNCVVSALVIGLSKGFRIAGSRSRRSIGLRGGLVRRGRGIISGIVVHRIEDRNRHKSLLMHR